MDGSESHVRLIILGAGGHGRVVAESARTAGLDPIGFADDNPRLLHAVVLDLPVLGNTDHIEAGALPCDALLLGVGDNRIRLALWRRFQGGRLALPAVRHAHAWVSPSAKLGTGTVVMAAAVVQTNCRLGAAVIINTAASVDHDAVVGDGVHIAPGARLAGNVTVGDGTHIGIGASVIEGIHIGAGCLIAAGAVVVRDVPDGERVAGCPARTMKRTERQ